MNLKVIGTPIAQCHTHKAQDILKFQIQNINKRIYSLFKEWIESNMMRYTVAIKSISVDSMLEMMRMIKIYRRYPLWAMRSTFVTVGICRRVGKVHQNQNILGTEDLRLEYDCDENLWVVLLTDNIRQIEKRVSAHDKDDVVCECSN